jgi:hypothetical protein
LLLLQALSVLALQAMLQQQVLQQVVQLPQHARCLLHPVQQQLLLLLLLLVLQQAWGVPLL